MKKIVVSILSIVVNSHVMATTYTLAPQSSDGIVDADDAILSINAANGRVGNSSGTAGYGGADIFAFALPQIKLPYGTQVSASLSIDCTTVSSGLNFDTDLYSLGISPSSAIYGSDYFNGTYASDTYNLALQQHFTVPTSTPGWIQANAQGSAALSSDISNYLTNMGIPGTTEYYFLRLSPDFASPTDEDLGYIFDFQNSGTTTQPQLTITTTNAPELGRVMIEYWTAINNGQVLTDLTSLATYTNDTPSSREEATVMSLPGAASPTGLVTNWGTGASGARIMGIFYPTTTGTYTFQLTSNAQSALYFGTQASNILGSSPNVIASLASKNEAPVTSGAQVLTAGTPYYIAAVEKSGPLDANPCPTLSIAYTTPTNNTMSAMPTTNVAPYDPSTPYVAQSPLGAAPNEVSKTLCQGQVYGGVTDPLRGHPRLMISPAALARLYTAINVSGSVSATWWAQLQANANTDITAGPVPMGTSSGTFLSQAVVMNNQIYTLALVYNLTTNTTLQASCLTAIINQLKAVESWQCPVPNTSAWGAGTNSSNTQFLAVAEITHAYAIGYDWCYSGIVAQGDQTEFLNDIVTNGLIPGESVYTTYQTYVSEGQQSQLNGTSAWWVNVPNNWSIVCSSGLMMGALAVLNDETSSPQAPLILDEYFPSLSKGNLAMQELGPDGGWPEAHTYWQYVTRYLATLMASLETSTGTNYQFDQTPGLASTGIQDVYDSGPQNDAFPFGDAPSFALTPAPSNEYFGLKYNEPIYSWSEIDAINENTDHTTENVTPMDLVWYDSRAGDGGYKAATAPVNPVSIGLPLVNYLSCGLVSMRTAWQEYNCIYVGVKAGSNQAGHSELQAGAFYLDAGGANWITMLGRGDYDGTPLNYGAAGYFQSNPWINDNHWQFYNARAEGNNTLLVETGTTNSPDGGQTFLDGYTISTLPFPFPSVANVTNLSSSLDGYNGTPEQKCIIDMTNAYKLTDGDPWNQVSSSAGVTSAKRGIRIVNQQKTVSSSAEGTVQVQDEVTVGANSTIYWNAHFQTTSTTCISGNGTGTLVLAQSATPTKGAPVLSISVQSPAGATLEVMNPIQQLTVPSSDTPYPPTQSNENGAGKFYLKLSGVSGAQTITVSMSPYLYESTTVPALPPVVPLSTW